MVMVMVMVVVIMWERRGGKGKGKGKGKVCGQGGRRSNYLTLQATYLTLPYIVAAARRVRYKRGEGCSLVEWRGSSSAR